MGANLMRVSFLFLTFSLLCVTSQASDGGDDNATASSVKKLVIAEFEKAYRRVNERIEVCNKRAESNVIEKDVIPTRGLTDAQIRLALTYNAQSARDECVEDASGSLALAVNRIEKFGYANDLPEKVRTKYDTALLEVEGAKEDYEFKLKYLEELPPAYRARIKEIDALDEPFNLIKTVDEYGVSILEK